jgi:hypothetical protein
VKYRIMLYGSQPDYDMLAGVPGDRPVMSPEQIAAMHAHMESIHKELAETGELVDAQGLTAPVHARRVRLRGGAPVVTDGPYAETQEVLAATGEDARPLPNRRGPGHWLRIAAGRDFRHKP